MAKQSNGVGPRSSETSGIYAHIVGWGMSVPDTRLTNEDLEAILDTNDAWIQSRTGIRERRIAGERDSTVTLGFKAAKQALEVTDILPSEIDLIIVATSTPESVFPTTASLIQNWLGANHAGAFDLSAACSGFVYGIQMAAQSIRSGSIKTALVIGSEVMSRVMDWQDRSTCILFGDGAGAVVLQGSETEGGVLSAVLRSDGSGYDLLGLPVQGSRDNNGYRKPNRMFMIGSEVFKFATRVIGESITEATVRAGIRLTDVKLIIPHQANDRILQAAARSLDLDRSIFMSNLAQYGNTSAASIPIALCEAVREGRIQEGDYIVLVGFGGGLAWGSVVIKWGIPQPQERQGSRLNRERRRAAYALVGVRARLRHWSRRLSRLFSQVRPNYGRLHRLRRKIDQYDLE
ncbi:MAG: beta-ketoacyl-ACP synthase III [bacterium]|nr:beta-ketoacyl-ACP synthase III [bacterium]